VETLKYTKEHEWIKVDGSHATIGVTEYAVEQLGDVVYLDLPKPGLEFSIDEAIGTIESTKTVSDLYSPLNCKVLETNQVVIDNPEILTKDSRNDGWLIKAEILGEIPTTLLTEEEYKAYINEIS